ncbi:hypothetical protein HanPSC8_Chr09g0364311 [Helianthus annuus]|nr:hypothetical protein HanPSC8_Chr09g0364311 [Helianthus annuus]
MPTRCNGMSIFFHFLGDLLHVVSLNLLKYTLSIHVNLTLLSTIMSIFVSYRTLHVSKALTNNILSNYNFLAIESKINENKLILGWPLKNHNSLVTLMKKKKLILK